MKLVKPYFEILEQDSGISGVYKAIEWAGRLSYKSEDRITEISAKPFVDKLITAGHLSCLEHGTVYLKIPLTEWDDIYVYKLGDNPYTKYEEHIEFNKFGGSFVYVTTNYRVIKEWDLNSALRYISEPCDLHHRRIGVFFNSDIGTMRELFRHRKMSYIQESSRFVNYSSGKFNRELTFILPSWLSIKEENYTSPLEIFSKTPLSGYEPGEEVFLNSLLQAEQSYMTLIDSGWKPEQARNVLPLATKSEAIVTGFVSDWKHIFRLRTSIAETGRPHPQMLELMDPLYEEFIRRNLISKIK